MGKEKASQRASKSFLIRNDLGLHARAAAKLVQIARQYCAEVRLMKDGNGVDGKSILDVLALACPKGCYVDVVVMGPDAQQALEALGRLIEDGFGEL